MSQVSEAVDAAINRYGVSQRWLAEVAGVAPSTVARLRSGKNVRFANAVAVAKVLGLEFAVRDEPLSDTAE